MMNCPTLALATCLALSFCSLTFTLSIESDPIIQTSSGIFIGKTVQLENNLNVNNFLGIPYAQSPVGTNRFEKPLEIVNQSDKITMAQEFKPTCIQMKHLTQTISPLLDVDEGNNISEDCLYLNIYAPVTNETSLPIMVWLPGEGFDFADARQFNGAYLASMGNVIVITVQYRVGIFGFLKENAGIWDQLTALKWINRNAHTFGGNAENVTLFGRFTGSMSISILLSSPQTIQSSVPLFTRAILMSGIAVGNWVFDKKHNDKLRQVLDDTECVSLRCLKTLPATELLAKSGYGWKPFIDSTLINEEPLSALSNSNFPKYVTSVMLGTNQFEGNLCLLKHLVVDKPFYDKLVNNNISTMEYESAIRDDLEMFYGEDVHSAVATNYSDGIIKDRSNYVEFCSELLINSHMKQFNTLLHKISANHSYNLETIFNYKLDYKPSFSIAPDFINSSIHGDDVILAFGLAFKNNSQISEHDREISGLMVSLFSTFAQTGYPYKSSQVKFVEIKLGHSYNLFQWKLNNTLLAILVGFTIVILMLLFLIKLLKQFLTYQPSAQQIKHLIENYN